MWLVHIDSWAYPDPQKVIDLIPQDIRPYVVMNISLSINHDSATGEWRTLAYGYETAKSWLRTCAENRMWAMIQPSSGGYSHFSDTDLTIYREFYTNYPNFLGFNYCEQFWGFDDPNDGRSPAWTTRIAHFVDLIDLADEFGGYLVVSWCGAYYGAGINPIAMMKRNPAFASVLRSKSDHFILCEKFTSRYGFYDIESTCLGAYLSNYSGQYGIRFDQTGWTGADGESNGSVDDTFPVSAGAAPVIEHLMLTGQTVIDGPELTWLQAIHEINTGTTSDGFTTRRWATYPQFDNISLDIFRKVLDGTIRILSRSEVIDRTKLVIINDLSSGSDVDRYSAPAALFDELYRMDTFADPNHLLWNRTWFKKTGRYPAIPTVYALNGTDADSFQVKVDKSTYSSRWPAAAAKVDEFNRLFPQEYTGTIYASRSENAWVTYNPNKTATTAAGNIPFKYNTCTSLDLTYSQFTTGIVTEYSDQIIFYLTNYDNANAALKTDVITINGCSSQPTYSFTDRGSHVASSVTSSYSGGTFTLTVTHNGPLDITVNCSGAAIDRLTSYRTATLVAPNSPPVYTGPRQYEAENFDYKNTGSVARQGIGTGVSDYTAMGYLQFGTNPMASIRKTVTARRRGVYDLAIRYSAFGKEIITIDLLVNGTKVSPTTFTPTSSYSAWAINNQRIILKAGSNTIELRANAAGASTIYFDNIVLTAISTIPPITVSGPPAGNQDPVVNAGADRSLRLPASARIDKLVGFAAVNALDQNGTTGGAGGPTVIAATADEFLAFIAQPGPLVIKVSGMITLPGSMHSVTSDKTIVGIGATSGLTGGGLNIGLPLDDNVTSPPADAVHNVIIRNLSFTNCPDDCLNVQMFSHHVWIDHNDLESDEALDIKRGSDYLTVSWNHFHDGNRNLLPVRDDSNRLQDLGRLRVTYHHNFFDASIRLTPQERFGELAHVFNNYYLRVTGYNVVSQVNAGILSENNYFDDVEVVRRLEVAGDPGRIVERNNINVNADDPIATNGTAVEPSSYYSYDADLQEPEEIPDLVSSFAGVGKLPEL